VRVVRAVFFLFLLFSASFAGERIVSLSPALTESLFYLGAGDELVGVSVFCDLPQCREKEKVGGIVNPNIEKIISLRPTLVVASTMTPERVLKPLKSMGIKVRRFSLLSLQELKESLKTLSELTGRGKGKEELFFKELSRRAKELSSCLEGKRLVIVISCRAPILAGSSSYLGELLELSGAKVFPEGSFVPVSREFFYLAKKDLILSFCGCSLFKGAPCYELSRYKSDFFHLSPRLLKALSILREEICRP
jgi:iron complex transport system substrate-binding protein